MFQKILLFTLDWIGHFFYCLTFRDLSCLKQLLSSLYVLYNPRFLDVPSPIYYIIYSPSYFYNLKKYKQQTTLWLVSCTVLYNIITLQRFGRSFKFWDHPQCAFCYDWQNCLSIFKTYLISFCQISDCKQSCKTYIRYL